MKQLIVLLSVFITFNLQAQEVISETSKYITYQDTLFVLQNTTITNNGIEGINDTVIKYVPPAVDTAGLVNLIYTSYINTTNTRVANMRKALGFRKTTPERTETLNTLGRINSNLDSINVQKYASLIKGKYRLRTDSTNFIINIINHPANNRFLRAKRVGRPITFNVRIFSRWWIAINLNGKWQHLIWDGNNRRKQMWVSPTKAIPNVIAQHNTIRLINIK